MNDLLPHLRDAPVPDALGALDDAVLAALATRRREQATGPRLLALAALLSLAAYRAVPQLLRPRYPRSPATACWHLRRCWTRAEW